MQFSNIDDKNEVILKCHTYSLVLHYENDKEKIPETYVIFITPLSQITAIVLDF